jgi:hypothetical protein
MTDVGENSSPKGADARTPGPIFIVGSMRSGSTLLRLIVDSHPRIAIGPETGFMGAVAATKTIPNWKNGKDWYRRLNWDEDEVNARLRDFYDGMFLRYATAQGKSRWGEKTPFHTSHMAAMAEVFPDAVFIGIVRHPGAVAASLRKSFHYDFADAVSYWSATNLEMVRAATDLGSRFVACRYEDILQTGEPLLREVTDFLEEDWSPSLLQHDATHRDKGTPRVAEGSTLTTDAIDAARAARWTQSATQDDYRALGDVSALAAFFGYEPTSAEPARPLVPPGSTWSWLATGEDLRARRLEWKDRVDFEARPPTLVIDADPQQLAERLARAEAALVRVRSRKANQLIDALRQVQRGRSVDDMRRLLMVVRGLRR